MCVFNIQAQAAEEARRARASLLAQKSGAQHDALSSILVGATVNESLHKENGIPSWQRKLRKARGYGKSAPDRDNGQPSPKDARRLRSQIG